MFDLSLFRLPTFVGGSLAAFSLSASLFALQLYLVLYLQDVLGYSAFGTGLRLLVLSGGILLTSTIAGRLTSHVPVRFLIGPGLLLVGIGLLLMRRINPGSDWTVLIPGLFLSGVGTGLVNPPLASTAVGVVEPARSGMASGINSTFRQVGIATGIATFGSLFASAGDRPGQQGPRRRASAGRRGAERRGEERRRLAGDRLAARTAPPDGGGGGPGELRVRPAADRAARRDRGARRRGARPRADPRQGLLGGARPAGGVRPAARSRTTPEPASQPRRAETARPRASAADGPTPLNGLDATGRVRRRRGSGRRPQRPSRTRSPAGRRSPSCTVASSTPTADRSRACRSPSRPATANPSPSCRATPTATTRCRSIPAATSSSPAPPGCQPDARRVHVVPDGALGEPTDFALDGDGLLYGRVSGRARRRPDPAGPGGDVVAGSTSTTTAATRSPACAAASTPPPPWCPERSPLAEQVEVLPGDAREHDFGLGPADLTVDARPRGRRRGAGAATRASRRAAPGGDGPRRDRHQRSAERQRRRGQRRLGNGVRSNGLAGTGGRGCIFRSAGEQLVSTRKQQPWSGVAASDHGGWSMPVTTATGSTDAGQFRTREDGAQRRRHRDAGGDGTAPRVRLQVDRAVEHHPRRADGDHQRLDPADRPPGHLPGDRPRTRCCPATPATCSG